MKRLLTFLLIIASIISGCTSNRPAGESVPRVSQEKTEVTTVTEEDLNVSSPPKKNSVAVDSFYSDTGIPGKKNSVAVDSTYSDTANSNKDNSTAVDSAYSDTGNSNKDNSTAVDFTCSDTGNFSQDNSTTVDSTHSDTGIPEGTEPPMTEPPAITEPAEEAENTSPTEPPTQATSPPGEETTVPSQPVEETQPEPEFEISYWISFAKTYAQSVGLNLDAAAVDCWDNPITAGAHCIYLERDITNRLNRYSKDEDITDVWIWAVDLGNGTYDLYIGYA